jgi:hypothetical protein
MEISEANELLRPIRDDFLVRFYLWAKADSAREFSQDFPFLRRIRNEAAIRFVEFAGRLNHGEKRIFSGAMVKRFHTRAVELLNDQPSNAGLAIINLFTDWRRAQDGSAVTNRSVANKIRFRRLLIKKLVPIMKDPIILHASHESWVHQQEVGQWLIRTCIDIGGRKSLQYSHSISARESVPLLDNTSLISWLGISAGDWPLVLAGEEESTANCLVDLCSHFLEAAPALLKGLVHDLPEPRVRSWKQRVMVKRHRKNGFTTIVLDSPVFQRTVGAYAALRHYLQRPRSWRHLVMRKDQKARPLNQVSGRARVCSYAPRYSTAEWEALQSARAETHCPALKRRVHSSLAPRQRRQRLEGPESRGKESHPPVLRRSVPRAEYSLHPAKQAVRINAIVVTGIDLHGSIPSADHEIDVTLS